MSVSTKHPLYNKYSKRWVRAKDLYDGEDQIKSKGETYLKRTAGQLAIALKGQVEYANEVYDLYKHRSEIPDIFAPSIIGLTGLACRVSWEIELPPAMEYLRDNASSGIPIAQMQGKLIQEGLKYGRLGHFIDTDPVDGELRIALYDAQSIINWKRDYNETNLIVLSESHEEDLDDIFTHEYKTVYRVLRIIDGKYVVEVHRPNDQDGNYTDKEIIADLDFQEEKIPFTFQGSTGIEVDPDVIPLEGMILQCLKYYNLSADLYHDIHMSNTSTLFGKGFEKGDIEFAGAGAAIITSNAEADLKFVSTTGEGQANAIAMMDRKIEMAEKQSHRMADSVGGVEASSTLAQKVTSKTATLRSVEENALMAFNMDLKMIATMMSLDPDTANATSSYEYTDTEIESTLLTAFSNASAAGTLPEDAAIEYVMSTGMYPDIEKDELIQIMEEQREEREARAVGFAKAMSEDDDEDDNFNASGN